MKVKILGAAVAVALAITAVAAATIYEFRAPVKLRDVSANARAQSFRGVTTDGKIMPGLFALAQTGVSTEPVRKVAAAFVSSLNDAQRKKTLFPVDDDEWRTWDNRHFAAREGMGFSR